MSRSISHAEQHDQDEAGDHRRHGERQVDERDHQALAPELELGDGPGGADAEEGVGRHHDGGRQQRQADGRQGVRVAEALQVRLVAFLEGLGQHGAERRDEQQREEGDGDEDEHDARGAGAERQVAPGLDPWSGTGHVSARPASGAGVPTPAPG